MSRRDYAEQYRAFGGIARIRASVAATQRCAISDCAGRAAEVSAVVIQRPRRIGTIRVFEQRLRAVCRGGTAVDIVLMWA